MKKENCFGESSIIGDPKKNIKLELRNSSVSTEKLKDKAVSTDKLADNSVTNSKMLNSSVTNSKLADNTITSTKLEPGLRSTIISTYDKTIELDNQKANIADVGNAIERLENKIGERFIVEGDVTNLPDEEDLTSVSTIDGREVMKLNDRAYEPSNFSGKGYKILRKNIKKFDIPTVSIVVSYAPTSSGDITITVNDKVTTIHLDSTTDTTTAIVATKIAAALKSSLDDYDVSVSSNRITLTRHNDSSVSPSSINVGNTSAVITVTDGVNKNVRKNVLTKDMVKDSNTIYEIKYDFDLNNEEITIPENCVLYFVGGGIKGGAIVFNNTEIAGSYRFKDITDATGSCISESLSAERFLFVSDIKELVFLLSQSKVKNIYLRHEYIYQIDTTNYSSCLIRKENVSGQSIYGNNCKIIDTRLKDTLHNGASLSYFDLLRFTKCSSITISDLSFICSDKTIEYPVGSEKETFGQSFIQFIYSKDITLSNIMGQNLCNGIALTKVENAFVSCKMTNVGYNIMLNYVNNATVMLDTYEHTHRIIYSGAVSNSKFKVRVLGSSYTATASGVVLQDFVSKDEQIISHNHDNVYDFKIIADFKNSNFIRQFVYYKSQEQWGTLREQGYIVEGIKIIVELYNQTNPFYVYESTLSNRGEDTFPLYFKGEITLLCHDNENTTEDIYPMYVSAGPIGQFNNTYYNFDVNVIVDGKPKKKKIRLNNLVAPSVINLYSNSQVEFVNFYTDKTLTQGLVRINAPCSMVGQLSEDYLSPNVDLYRDMISFNYKTLSGIQILNIKNGITKEFTSFRDAFLSRCEYPIINGGKNINVYSNDIVNFTAKNESRRIKIVNNSTSEITIAINVENLIQAFKIQAKESIYFTIHVIDYKIYIDYVSSSIPISGLFSRKPTLAKNGFQYFNTDTHKMITWDGSKWWNPDGTEATS